MSVKINLVTILLDSGKQVVCNMQTQVLETPNLSLKGINEANEKLAKWQRKHKL